MICGTKGVRRAITLACFLGVRVYTPRMHERQASTAPLFSSSSVVIDWSKDKMQNKYDSASLLQWVQSFPSRDDVHIYLGNVSFNGDRILMRQLQAMGCTVTCRQYRG
jgi:hypothetical protein